MGRMEGSIWRYDAPVIAACGNSSDRSALPIFCPPGRAGLGAWWRGGYADWTRQNEWTIAPWVLPDFARRHGLSGRALNNSRRVFHAGHSMGLSLALRSIGEHCGDFSRWHLAAPQGMVLTHPFLDPRVLCLGLGIQTRVRPQPGTQKPILAAAMRDILPDVILKAPRKGHFNEVYYMGLSRNLQSLEALIQQAPVDGSGIFDKTVLLDCLAPLWATPPKS